MERKEILVIGLIVVLLLVVGLQTVQVVGLTKTQVIVPTGASGPVNTMSTGGSSPSVPTNLQNLPSMVGGC